MEMAIAFERNGAAELGQSNRLCLHDFRFPGQAAAEPSGRHRIVIWSANALHYPRF